MLFNKKSYKGLILILAASLIGTGTFSYIPTVYAESNQPSPGQETQLSSTLSKLEIEGIKLDQEFSPNIITYTATVENEITSIQLNVEAALPESSITINGQQVTNGNLGPLPLQTGDNIFLITVNDGTNSPTTYTLTVTRKKNGNNLLQDIKLSKGELSPKFVSSITDYNVEVTNEVDSITVTPETAEKTTNIKVNDSVIDNKGVAVQVPIGKSDITILVTAENGDKRTYLIHVTRAAKPIVTLPGSNKNPRPTNNTGSGKNTGSGNYNKSSANGAFSRNNSNTMQQQSSGTIQKTSTATLSALTVSGGTWDSTFSKNEYTYHIAIASDVNTVTLSPSATYSSAVISINGGSSKTISLTGNKTVIPILVTRGEDRKTYVLVFDKPVQQTKATTVTVQQTTNTSIANTPNSSITQTVSGTTDQKIKKNKTQKTFWQKIAAFFKKLF